MSDFTTLQDELHNGRQQTRDLQQQLARERATVKAADEALRQLDRQASDNDRVYLQKKQRLEAQRNTASNNANAIYGRLKAAAENNHTDLTRFLHLGDPAKLIENLGDQTPFLLFPVRLETRFKSVDGAIELWLRIYPDDCLADNFEEMLTTSELDEAKRFWTSMWQSGGIEAQQRAAWRTLVASFGAGRATWIYRQYQPLNLAARPSKLNPWDQILTIATDKELSNTAATAAVNYWKAVWLADGDHAQEEAAYIALVKATDDATATDIRKNYTPANIDASPPPPYQRNTVQVSVSFVVFPADDTVSTNSSTWTKAPAANLLPDQFTVIGFKDGKQTLLKTALPVASSLDLGPDPSLPKEDQLHLTPDGDLDLNEGLKWLTDFDKAAAVGMAVKIRQSDLSSGTLAGGFDQLIVLGLRLSDNAAMSKTRLQQLLENHYYSKRGFELLPQGVPTNNTEETSGYTRLDNADESYDVVFGGKDLFTETSDLWQKKDGQWLAEYIGLDTEFFKTIPHAGGNDQGEARALNTALWPATLGYFMDEMMDGVFTDQDIAQTRGFFNRYVSGRGSIPAIRIGKQPYGILPATAYSRMEFANDPAVKKIYNVIKKLDTEWAAMSDLVTTVTRKGPKPHQQVLDVVALQASSVEFHQRYAESLMHVFNSTKLGFADALAAIIAEFVREKGKSLLARWGIDTSKNIPILDKLFLSRQNLLSGDLIDDKPLSETDAIRAYSADNKNYLEWLATVAFDDILRENFGGKKAPTALLYLLLRHAVMEQHNQTSRQLYQDNNVFTNAKLSMKEPDLLFVAEKETGTSQLKWLYQAQPVITKKPNLTVAEYIYTDLRKEVIFPNYYLSEVFKALQYLKDVPTARLERAFTEHLDCCGYRLDAWMLGFAHHRLEQQRLRREAGGIYLGAFGYVEDLKPEHKTLTPVQLPRDLDIVFNNKPDLPPLQRDSTNAGYIHAPSINQAKAAAILKNAYIEQAREGGDNPFEIDLSSERVRLALGVLEGIRNGQSLSALLGYRFERGLHDKHSLGQGEVDVLIYPLRMVFPLIAGKIEPDPPPAPGNEPQSIQNLESRNVLDGLKLLEHIRKSTVKEYPWGLPIGDKPGQVHAATPGQKTAVQQEVDALFDMQDAVGDLLLSESVYQALMGNYEKAAANTDVSGKGAYPPETEVVQTERSGLTLTHRLALQLDATAVAVAGDTPRAQAEPALHDWLKGLLPAENKVAAIVTFTLPNAALPGEVTVTQQDLGLVAIDLLYLLDMHSETAMSELDDRIVDHVRRNNAKHPGATITIAYTQKIPGSFTFFELAALLKSLRALILPSRYLEASDLALPLQQGLTKGVQDDAELKTRIDTPKTALTGLVPGIQTLIDDVATATEDYAVLIKPKLLQLSLYGIPQTGIGFIGDTVYAIYDSVIKQLQPLIQRWNDRLTEYTTLLGTYAAQPDNAAKMDLLQRAERLISTSVTSPLPADPDTFKTNLENFRTTKFQKSLGDLEDLTKTNVNSLADFLNLVEPVVKNEIAPYDHEFFDPQRKKNDIDDKRTRLKDFRGVLTEKLTQLRDDLNKRIAAVNTAFTDADKEKDNTQRVKLLLSAAKNVMGDDFRFIPRFKLADGQGIEVANCVGDSDQLLSWLEAKQEFPLDDWLHGLARVRGKLQHWENIGFLTEAFGTHVDALTPLQLPYQKDDRWLGMEFPEDYDRSGEKLLYTGYFTKPFNSAGFQCGLMLDEWVELIPNRQENMGITFHYDQPNTEPPQTLLLVTQAQFRGNWQWNDVVDSIKETFLLARKRAVDPQLIDQSDFAQLLPAIIMSANLYPILIATNLAINNQLYEKIKPS